jgi:cysteine synthase
MKSPCAVVRYCLASGAAKIWRQAAGNCASVIGGFGFGGTFGGLGWIVESLNQ